MRATTDNSSRSHTAVSQAVKMNLIDKARKCPNGCLEKEQDNRESTKKNTQKCWNIIAEKKSLADVCVFSSFNSKFLSISVNAFRYKSHCSLFNYSTCILIQYNVRL